jgi:CRP-like cAMP-binding protein/class 3 adenylate cyclase
MNQENRELYRGVQAVLGMDIVSFSTLSDEDQVSAIKFLMQWIRNALAYQKIDTEGHRWSPAGDGGYLTFSPQASERALDVAFLILEQTVKPDWVPRTGSRVELRFGVNAGSVQEGEELGGGTNIWGDGINMAARTLSVAATSQILVSTQYYDVYIRNKREKDFEFGDSLTRTVKHGVRITVRNVQRGDLGLKKADEVARRWYPIGSIWRKTVESYIFLVNDAMECDDAIACLAATKFLMELKDTSPETFEKTEQVFNAVGDSGFQRQRISLRHPIFNVMPPPLLKELLSESVPKTYKKGSVICREGDPGDTCFFPVYGTLQVEGSNIDQPIDITPGQIIGEFSLWIPDISRTATVTAKDDSMVLQVPIEQFVKLCLQNKDMAERIYAIIRRRLLENVTRSKSFFPRATQEQMARLMNFPTIVEKHKVKTQLDLREKAHIVFKGSVRMRPPLLEGRYFDISTFGHFSAESVIGVPTQIEATDGDSAEVLEDCVVVSMPHDVILKLMEESKHVQEAWDGIWGRRRASLERHRKKHSVETQVPRTRE